MGGKETFFSLHDPCISSEFSHVHVFSTPLRTHSGKSGEGASELRSQLPCLLGGAEYLPLCPSSVTTCGTLALFRLVLGIPR